MFFDKVGTLALGSRLRMLSESVMEDAQKVYDSYDVDLKSKWFPVFYLLTESKEKSITSIAEEIGHSHPSVSKIVQEMCKAGVAIEKKDKTDGRRNLISLTKKGINISNKIQDQYLDVNAAVDVALAQTKHNIWKAIEEFEFLLSQKSLVKRVEEQKKIRESGKVKIVPFSPKYSREFSELNEEWIKANFKMEMEDVKALTNPKEYILNKGGHILVALYNKEVMGVCALIKMNDQVYDYELAKMAVSPKARGKGIGWLLGQAIIKKAKSLKARNLYLESNTKLKPAITLYYKLGFDRVAHSSPYERSNIQMAMDL